jgi:hypothetical protein
MHDNTDAARLMKSSDSEMQRATWSTRTTLDVSGRVGSQASFVGGL